jgi:hypothetical protein
LGFNLSDSLWLRRQLKNHSLLILTQACQKHNLAVGKFQRIVMSRDLFFVDLPKDRRLVLDYFIPPTQQARRQARNFVGKGQLSSRKNADRDGRIFRCRKSPRARAKVARGKFIANSGGSRFDAVNPFPFTSASIEFERTFTLRVPDVASHWQVFFLISTPHAASVNFAH